MVSRTCLQESRVLRSNAMTISNWAQDNGHYYSQPTQCIVIFGKSLKNCHRFICKAWFTPKMSVLQWPLWRIHLPGTPNNQHKLDVFWNNHFPCKGLKIIQLKQPFINACLGFQVGWWIFLRIFRWLWQQAASKASFWAPGFSGPTSITSITMGPSFTFVVWWGWPGVTWWRLHPLNVSESSKKTACNKKRRWLKKIIKKTKKDYIYIYILYIYIALANLSKMSVVKLT